MMKAKTLNTVACPACLGQGKKLDFAVSNRSTGEEGGWKAMNCTECAGSGQVTPDQAEALRERLRIEQEAAQVQAAEGGVFRRAA